MLFLALFLFVLFHHFSLIFECANVYVCVCCYTCVVFLRAYSGGSTWAGGTGGSRTAGLGGVGGPYRLDAGHTVHQVSDEVKASISKEAAEAARKMGQRGL